MRFPFPDFVPVPAPETMHIISIVSPMAGICLVCAAAFFLFRGRGAEGEKRHRLSWISMAAGALLIPNHGLQLLF